MGLKPRCHRKSPGRRAAFTGVARRVRALVTGGFLLAFQASIFAAGPTPPPAGTPGSKTRHPGAATLPAPETAVVYDDAYHPPAKDLQLGLDGERKSEAIARFMHGLLLEDSNGADEPMGEYLKSLALDPANVELSVGVAQDYLRKGDVPAAINLLKDSLKAAPKRAEPALALAYVYYTAQNKADLAQKSAAQALELDPNNIEAYVYLRILYLATDQTAKVAPLLERAAKSDSKDPDFWLQLGKLYIQTFIADDPPKTGGEANGKRQPFRLGGPITDDLAKNEGEDLKKTTAIFQRAAAVGFDNAEVANKVANYYSLTKQYREAIPLFTRVLELDPGQTAARENLARCFLAVEEPAKAALTLEELVKINPADPHAYELLGKIYENAGDYTKAGENYEQALLVNPADIQGYENITLMLLNHKQPEKAVAVLNEARHRFPDRPGFSYLLAVALERAKQHQQSLTVFEQTELEAQSAQPSLLSGQFYFEFGATAEQAGLYDRAALLMKKSLGLEDDPHAIANTSNYLGYMWVDHNMNMEEGGDLIKRAVEADPENGAYLDSLGWYYYKTNQFEQAAVQLTKAVQKTEPEDPTVYQHLGDTYWKQNDAAKAVASWQRAIDLDPKGANASELSKKIAVAKAPAAPLPAPTPKG